MRQHLCAMGLLAAVGLVSIIGIGKEVPGLLGTRAFGYGALFLVGAALAIGPLARLQPRRFARLLPYRRAVGIWSAVAGILHLWFALEYIQGGFYKRPWLALFLTEYAGYTPDGTRYAYYRFPVQDHLGVLSWTGAIALGLLVIVALTSNDRVQRFLGQSSWKLIQQQAYTAFLLAAMHVLILKLGKLKMSPPLSPMAVPFLAAVALLQMAGFGYTVWKHRARSGSPH